MLDGWILARFLFRILVYVFWICVHTDLVCCVHRKVLWTQIWEIVSTTCVHTDLFAVSTCVHMMNILKRDPMRDVNSVLADILGVASCLVCLVEQSPWQLRRQYNRSCANLEKKNFRRKHTKYFNFTMLFSDLQVTLHWLRQSYAVHLMKPISL